MTVTFTVTVTMTVTVTVTVMHFLPELQMVCHGKFKASATRYAIEKHVDIIWMCLYARVNMYTCTHVHVYHTYTHVGITIDELEKDLVALSERVKVKLLGGRACCALRLHHSRRGLRVYLHGIAVAERRDCAPATGEL